MSKDNQPGTRVTRLERGFLGDWGLLVFRRGRVQGTWDMGLTVVTVCHIICSLSICGMLCFPVLPVLGIDLQAIQIQDTGSHLGSERANVVEGGAFAWCFFHVRHSVIFCNTFETWNAMLDDFRQNFAQVPSQRILDFHFGAALFCKEQYFVFH